MKRKRASPAASENEFDISAALAGAPIVSDDNSDNEAPQRDLEPWRESVLSFAPADGESDDDEAFIAAQQAASNRKSANLKGKTVKKGGGFQAMGLNAALLKAITRKGFSVPTPIQRKTIPLILEANDVVGMARTGSGKTAAFVIPMIQKLKAHSARVGARAIIMSPSRELALQTLKVVKEMGRGTDLRCVLLVGGDSLEEQFSSMTSNPDIVIATPGRFLHLKVEMKLDLSSVQYVVFDEADRLFEMGFAVQLTEIMVGLPTTRQTLLFSATLPKSLVEFARAGLQEPKLVRLDAESKISPDLESAFFMVKNSEKEGALLQILQDIIRIPTISEEQRPKENEEDDFRARKKRKRIIEKSGKGNFDSPTEYSTIVFAATKHHVEYLSSLLRFVGYAVSYVYGALDQTARKMQVQDFRDGITNILVVTDVAARGIDIPVLANVINYDFPPQPKIFVHRVGRTARAGRKGWSYSLLQDADLPYLLDLQLFLSRKLVMGRLVEHYNCAEEIVLGTLPVAKLSANCEWTNKILEEDVEIDSLREVAIKGERLYVKTRNSASIQSVQRAKDLQTQGVLGELNPLFGEHLGEQADSRDNLLAKLRNFRPQETVFEIGKKGLTNETVETIRKTRQRVGNGKRRSAGDVVPVANADFQSQSAQSAFDSADEENEEALVEELSDASENELEVTFHNSTKAKLADKTWQDTEHFMSYNPRESNIAEDRGYGVISGGTSGNTRSDFLSQAKDASMDLFNDEVNGFGMENRSRMRWDKRSKKYVARLNDEDGSKGAKMVRGESGLKIAASLRSGRYDDWRKANGVGRMPRVGETETSAIAKASSNSKEPRYRHKTQQAPKEADRWRDDFHVQKKRVAEAKEQRIGRFRDGAGKNEIKSIDDVRKQRQIDQRKRARGAGRGGRGGRGGGRGGGGMSRGGAASRSRGVSSSRGRPGRRRGSR